MSHLLEMVPSEALTMAGILSRFHKITKKKNSHLCIHTATFEVFFL